MSIRDIILRCKELFRSKKKKEEKLEEKIIKTNPVVNNLEDPVIINLHKVESKKYVQVNSFHNHREFMPRMKLIEAGEITNIAIREKFCHGLLSALHMSFTDHVPFCWSPDLIWLLISQGIASHENYTKFLGKKFNLPKKKKEISVTRNSFVKGSGKNDWKGVFPEFTRKIKENIPNDLFDLVYKTFSTSGELEKICFAISLMDTMKNYFDYKCYTFCHIPQVILNGCKEDYEEIIRCVEQWKKIKKTGLEDWFQVLINTVQKFVDAFDGKIDKPFWDSIYKYSVTHGSGAGQWVNGWITVFFPYVEGKFRDYAMKSYLQGKYLNGALDQCNFPQGISCAPFIWNYLGTDIKMKFMSGFFGTKQLENGAVTASLGWVVIEDYKEEKPAKNIFFDF